MRKINFLGVEFNVANEQDRAAMGPGSIYVMIRVADAHRDDGSPALRARRLITSCDDCGETCWLDPESFKGTPGSIPKICMRCMVTRSKAD